MPKKTKVWASADEAVKDVKSGDVVLSGGLSGSPSSPSFGLADVGGCAQVLDFAAFLVSLPPFDVRESLDSQPCRNLDQRTGETH